LLGPTKKQKISQTIPNDKWIIRDYFAINQTNGTFGITHESKDLNGSVIDWRYRMRIVRNRREGHCSGITAPWMGLLSAPDGDNALGL
jgi:hypothetical protein